MKDMAEVFADFFFETSYEDLPSEVALGAKMQILDFIGVAIAGMCVPGAPEVRRLCNEFGGTPQALVWGEGTRLPITAAAQCNATAGHALDFDDVHEDAVMHPGVISVPTAFAFSDYLGGITGKDLITAVALSGDMISRMNIGLHPGKSIISYGWHLTTLNGSMVSALLSSKLLGLSSNQALHAIGLGYHQTCGNGQTTKDGGFAKRLGPGFAIRNGISAALLAQMGVTAAVHSMEADWGFYNVYHGGDYEREVILNALGDSWESAKITVKPYPCCRGTHNFIEAGIHLRNDHAINPDEIEDITIECGGATLELLGVPLEVKAHPQTVADAQFSCAWGVAVALATGNATLKEYSDSTEGIHNPAIRSIAAKVSEVIHNKEFDTGSYEAARVNITMKNGESYSHYQPRAKGSEGYPILFDDVVTKYRGNLDYAEKGISQENGEAILSLIEDLEQINDVREISDKIIWEDSR